MGKQFPEPDHQFKVPVVQRPEYTLYLERATRNHSFIHCDIHVRWSPQVKQRLLNDWKTLKDLHGHPIYALHTPGDVKHLKFLRMFGFKFLRNYPKSWALPEEIYVTKD